MGSDGIQGDCLPGYVCQSGSYSPMPYTNVVAIGATSVNYLTYNGPALPGHYSTDGANNVLCAIGNF